MAGPVPPSSQPVRRPMVSPPWRAAVGRAGPEDAFRSLPPARTRQCVRVWEIMEYQARLTLP
jgi:hypothetical protein